MNHIGTLYVGGQIDLSGGLRLPPVAASCRLGPDGPVGPMGPLGPRGSREPKLEFFTSKVKFISLPSCRAPAVGPMGPMGPNYICFGRVFGPLHIKPPKYGQFLPKSDAPISNQR